jgi:hypothetical protein
VEVEVDVDAEEEAGATSNETCRPGFGGGTGRPARGTADDEE